MKIFFLSTLLFFCSELQAQVDPAQVERDRAVKLTEEKDLLTAAEALTEALDIYQKNPFGNYHYHFNTIRELLENIRQTGDLELFRKETGESFYSVEEVMPDSTYALAKFAVMAGGAAIYTQRINEAIKYFERAKEYALRTENFDERGNVYNNLAGCQYHKGDYHAALAGFEEALKIYIEDDNKEALFNVYNNIGGCLTLIDDPVGAEAYYMKSLELLEKFKETVTETKYAKTKADTYFNLSSVQKLLGEFEASRNSARIALEIQANNSSKNHPDLISLYVGYAKSCIAMKDYKTAEELLYSALKIADANDYSGFRAEVNDGLAELYYQVGNLEKALDAARKSFSLYSANSSYYDKVDVAMKEVKILSDLNRFDEARGILDTVFQILSYEVELQPADVEDVFSVTTALGADAFCAYKISENKKSVATLRENGVLFDKWMRYLDFCAANRNNETGQRFLAAMKYIFEAAIMNYTELANITSEKKYYEKAFSYLEKSKALALRSRYQSGMISDFDNMPSKLLQLEYDLKQDIAYYRRTAKSNSPASLLSRENNDSLLVREAAYRELKKTFKNDYPRYFDLQFQNSTVALADIQKRLNIDEALLNFFTDDDHMIVCIILPDSVSFFSADAIEEEDLSIVYQNISQLPTAQNVTINTDQSEAFLKKVWHPLLAKLPDEVAELYIIPDGKLGYLPFEIFPLSDGSLTLEKYQVGYAYSAALRWFQEKEERNPKKFFAGFAPTYSDLIDSLPDDYELIVERSGEIVLPGAAAEVTRIAEKWDGDAFVGKIATADLFRTTAADYRILHLAGHALADDFNPLNSRLLFNDSLGNISAVNAVDLYGMKLNADLVVLSACNTGYGQLKKGEGIVSLHHAFTYAGAGAALMSLWAVPDKQTSEIMISFHDYLHAGESKTEALRAAKLDYLQNAKTDIAKHPYYWAGFVLTGDTAAIEVDKGYFWWYGLGITALLFFIGFIFFRKNNHP